MVYGALLGAIYGIFLWIPWEYDLFLRPKPTLNPLISPDIAKLKAKATRIVVITAHPDDSEFYLGGTLLELADGGAELYHLVVTDGDKGYYPFEDAAKNRRIRHQEQRQASGMWKAKEIIFLGYADGRYQVTDKVVSDIRTNLERWKPDYVLAFDPDYPPRLSHRDHRRAGLATSLALRSMKPADSPTWLLQFSTASPNWFNDVTAFWDRRIELLKIHASQFSGDRLKFVGNMIEERALEDGEAVKGTYGEGFRCLRLKPDAN